MDSSTFRQFIRTVIAGSVIGGLCLSASPSAQTHVVSRAELQSAVRSAKALREVNLGTVLSMLSDAKTETAFRNARVDAKQVRTAVSMLSDDELARIAARAGMVESDLAAGRLTERDLLLILVGLAALILIIVAVD